MNNIAIAPTSSGRGARAAPLPENEVSIPRAELEAMMDGDTYLKKVAAAAALLVARLDRVALHGGTATAAFTLAELIEGMPDGMLSEAMSLLDLSS